MSLERPKTLTRAWPVKASSTWELRSPVCFHWATNRPLERRVIALTPKMAIGTISRAMVASTQSMRNIAISTPVTVSTEVSIWLRVCWRLVARLSMSLVTRLSRSPRGWLST